MEEGGEGRTLLRWKDSPASAASYFQGLRARRELVDVTLVAGRGGATAPAHRLLLSASSPYLRRLLEASPCEHPVLILGDVGRAALSLVLEYMYTGEVRVAQSQLEPFLQAAELLQVKGLSGGQGKTDDPEGSDDISDPCAEIDPDAPETRPEAEGDGSCAEPAAERRPKRSARKRKRPGSTAEQGCTTSASKCARADAGSSEDDSCSTVPKETISLVDVDASSDAENRTEAEARGDATENYSYRNTTNSQRSVDTSDGLQLIQRLCGYPQLVHDDCIFNCQLYDRDYVHWVCQDNYRSNCRACVVTAHDRVVNTFGARHNHRAHGQEVEDQMLRGNFRVQPLRRDMFLSVRGQASSPPPW
ncbi:protein bric-a-brac 2-like [Bacillus rossius redtenbacheri]|uniref:protein bric-a-brac 2-like n=1 Tax=Bacillus rossius redtenbacheri TaxID=93214 RepID=UPI002FDC8349